MTKINDASEAQVPKGEELFAEPQDDLSDIAPIEDMNLKLQLEKENSIALTKMLQQLGADFDNYRKRNKALGEESRQKGVEEAINALLPAFDSLISARALVKDKETLEGFDMIDRELLKALKSLDVEPIASVGVNYDPNLHDVLVAEEIADVPSGQIVEEFKRGYRNSKNVIRVATVKIAK